MGGAYAEAARRSRREYPHLEKASQMSVPPIMAIKVMVIGTLMVVDGQGLCRGSAPVQVRITTHEKASQVSVSELP